MEDDIDADRRRAATDKDVRTAIAVVRLEGKIEGNSALNKQRFDQIDGAIVETKAAVHEAKAELHHRIDLHEADELPKMDTVRRLVWIAVGSIIILAGVVAFGLSVIQRSVFGGGP